VLSFESLFGESSMQITPVYLEVVDFIAAGPTPERIAAYHPSDAAQRRLMELLARHKSGELLPEEEFELENYLQLEHFMRLIKARARRYASA
jgi:hypothetical protein